MASGRLGYYYVKAKARWRSGALTVAIVRKLESWLNTFSAVLFGYPRLQRSDRRLPVAQGFADHRVAKVGPVNLDGQIAERLCAAYSLAKEMEATAPSAYEVRGLWREWIDIHYTQLIEAVSSKDYPAVLSLLENYCREPFSKGTGAGYDDLMHYRTPVLGRAYVKCVWSDYRDKLVDSGVDLANAHSPDIGNPCGVPINDCIVGTETLRHAYNAHEMIQLLRGVRSPVVVEIGGGFAGQAYQTITQSSRSGNPVGRYLGFDLPEVQIVAGYYLLKAFPNDKICLCGEGTVRDDMTIGIFPHFLIEGLPEMSADLVFNAHSFSEMDGESALRYLDVINRICRKYFMHINHEVPLAFRQADGTTSTNVVGSQMVPAPGRFKRLYKFPRVFGRPEDRVFRSFAYLYERM